MLDTFDALAAFASAAALFVVNAVFVVFVLLRPRVRQPSSLAWILVIVVLPVAGIVLYLAVGEVRTGSRRKRRHRTIQQNIRTVVQKAWSATSGTAVVPWGTESIARLARLGDETLPRQGNRRRSGYRTPKLRGVLVATSTPRRQTSDPFLHLS